MVFLIAALGLVLGSFVNALVWRLHEQEEAAYQIEKGQSNRKATHRDEHDLSILHGRSMCPNCRHVLMVKDLIPVFSWLWLRGQCRYCKQLISWQCPLVEAATAVLFAVSYIWWPLGFSVMGITYFIFWMVFLTAFVALTVYDIKWFILPDKIVFAIIGLAVVQLLAGILLFHMSWHSISQAAWGVIVIAGLFYLIYFLSRGAWIGFGDVKLGIVLGILAGGVLESALVIFLAALLGSIAALPMLIRGKANIRSHIPFGPFLLAGAYIVILWGGVILRWYESLLYLPYTKF